MAKKPGKKRCAAPGCGNNDSLGDISFHQFPASHDRRKLWLDALGLHSLPCRLVCSAHFANTCFGVPQALQAAGYKRRRLCFDAVPSRSVPPQPGSSAAGDGGQQCTNAAPELPVDELANRSVASIPGALVPSNSGFIRRNNPHCVQDGVTVAAAHTKKVEEGSPAQLKQEPNAAEPVVEEVKTSQCFKFSQGSPAQPEQEANAAEPVVEKVKTSQCSRFSQTPASVNANIQCSLEPHLNTQSIQLRWCLSSEGSRALFECGQGGFFRSQRGYSSNQDAATQTVARPVRRMETRVLRKMLRHSRYRRRRSRRTSRQGPHCPLCL